MVILTCGEDGVGLVLGGLLRLVRPTGDLDEWEGGFSWNTAWSHASHSIEWYGNGTKGFLPLTCFSIIGFPRS